MINEVLVFLLQFDELDSPKSFKLSVDNEDVKIMSKEGQKKEKKTIKS